MRFLAVFLLIAGAVFGQLEGRRVRVLVDLPGDDSGVEVSAGRWDAALVAERVAKYGIGVRRGTVATVTLVKAKGDHVEVHLNGGGFTNKQLLGLPGIDSVHWGITPEEKKLKYEISGTRDKRRRHQLEGDYDRVRARRVRPLRAALEREERGKFGSRFNVKGSVVTLEMLKGMVEAE